MPTAPAGSNFAFTRFASPAVTQIIYLCEVLTRRAAGEIGGQRHP